MKVLFSYFQEKSSKNQKQNIAFGAGLTPKMIQEINKSDVFEISSRLVKKGIPNDFKGNKVIAWSSNKVVEIFEQINKKFGPKLALPKGIFVDDFESLTVDNPNMYGFCNLQPTKLIKDSDKITPSRVIYFNNFAKKQEVVPAEHKWLLDWNYIDNIADVRFAASQSGTDFFLDLFIHEFVHVAHEDRLLSKFSGKSLAKKFSSIKDISQAQNFYNKYGAKISQICNYASTDPLEAVACHMPKVIIDSLDKETLTFVKNPFVDTPYEKLTFLQKRKNQNNNNSDMTLPQILQNFWDGKF